MNEPSSDRLTQVPFDAKSITKPAAELLTYYIIVAILTLPAVIFVLPVLWFRYITLRYRFDDEGVSMRWGVFFQSETVLTYRRIQDIHVTRDILQRWLGLATVSVQTASGSSMPEMKLEGILEAEALRDYLYQKMRGARGVDSPGVGLTNSANESNDHLSSVISSESEATNLLRSIRDNLAKLVDKDGARS